MNINQYDEIILSVYRNKSFTKAALELGVSQPALSATITKAEKNIGVRLFERSHQPIEPTEEGQIYIDYLKNSRKEYKNCFSKINDLVNKRNSKLVLGAPIAYASYYLPDILAEYSKDNEVEISIKVATLPELVEMADDGEIDCFVSTTGQLDSSFNLELMAKEDVKLCYPKKWAIKGFEGDSPDADWSLFDGCNIIVLEENQPLQKVVDSFFDKKKIKFAKRIVVNQVLLGVELCAKGLGMVVASDSAINSCSNLDDIEVVSLPAYIKEREIFIAYKNVGYTSKACLDFVNRIKI